MKGERRESMIKKTFLNLPSEKRERIMNEVKREFAKYPVDKISINRIIQRAKISRGSFYQYFDDKTDLIYLITGEFADHMYSSMVSAVNNSQGDIFVIPKEMFSATMEFVQKGDNFAVFKNLFSNIKANGRDLCEYFCRMKKEKLQSLEELVNSLPRNMESDEAEALREILLLAARGAIFDVFAKGKDVQSAEKALEVKIKLIKRCVNEDVNREDSYD